MLNVNRFIVFTLDEMNYALPLAALKKVVRATSVTPLPCGPGNVVGVLNVYGEIIPVINLRRWFQQPEQEIDAKRQSIIFQTSKGSVALLVDAVVETITYTSPDLAMNEQVLPDYIEAAIQYRMKVIFILNPDRLLSDEEEKILEARLLWLLQNEVLVEVEQS